MDVLKRTAVRQTYNNPEASIAARGRGRSEGEKACKLSRGGKTAHRLVRHGVGGKMGRNGDKNPSRRVARPTQGVRSFGSGREALASAGVHARPVDSAAMDYRVIDVARSKWCMKVVQNGAGATPGKV